MPTLETGSSIGPDDALRRLEAEYQRAMGVGDRVYHGSWEWVVVGAPRIDPLDQRIKLCLWHDDLGYRIVWAYECLRTLT